MSSLSSDADVALENLLAGSKRIPTSDNWFQVIKLPNDVYAFFEPGHNEKVNSFLIVGDKKDLLYDTGMGIASIKKAIQEVRKAEGLATRETIILNSHGHLDHIGGNSEFEKITALDDDWRIEKLTTGIAAGNPTWVSYFSDVTGTPEVPRSYNPKTFSIAPVTANKIELIQKNHVIDLGNRQFEVINSLSHTTDGVLLYERKQKILFTGDAFVPGYFYVMNYDELEKDLELMTSLDINFHYSTHGDQLIDLGLRKLTLEAVRKINKGEVPVLEHEMFGEKRKAYKVDGMYFFTLTNFLMY
jgi:glyoxylase-like metal-dependent hydrolase (beta-lactamase superfamily II)